MTTTPLRLFCGFDQREAVGFHAFAASVIRHAKRPIALIPLHDQGLPTGSNAFTHSRFLVPWLCGFDGFAVFADASDMIALADLNDLDEFFRPELALSVVKRADYRTRHPIKYRFTEMQCPNRDYPRKNWASLMVVNCAHAAWSAFTPAYVAAANPMELLQLKAFSDHEVGELPASWNCIADEGDDLSSAKILHWTAGIPGLPHYAHAPGADRWNEARALAMETP